MADFFNGKPLARFFLSSGLSNKSGREGQMLTTGCCYKAKNETAPKRGKVLSAPISKAVNKVFWRTMVLKFVILYFPQSHNALRLGGTPYCFDSRFCMVDSLAHPLYQPFKTLFATMATRDTRHFGLRLSNFVMIFLFMCCILQKWRLLISIKFNFINQSNDLHPRKSTSKLAIQPSTRCRPTTRAVADIWMYGSAIYLWVFERLLLRVFLANMTCFVWWKF